MSEALLLSLFFSLASAAIFIYVGLKLGLRKLTNSADKLGWFALRAFWLFQGASLLLTAVSTLSAAGGVTLLPLHIAIQLVILLSSVIALWGLLYYLVYVFSGSPKWLWPISGFYALFYIALVAYSLSRNPISVELTDNGSTIIYADEPRLVYGLALILMIILPQMIASLFYFSLVFKVKDRSQKYRVAMVSLSIFGWFGSAIVGALAGLSATTWWPLVNKLIPLAVAILVLWAYFPPQYIKHRFQIQSV